MGLPGDLRGRPYRRRRLGGTQRSASWRSPRCRSTTPRFGGWLGPHALLKKEPPQDDGRLAACRIQPSRIERGLGIAWVGDKPGAKPAGLGGLSGQDGGLAGHRGQLDEEGHERLIPLLGVDELREHGELDVLSFPEEGGDLVAAKVDVEVGTSGLALWAKISAGREGDAASHRSWCPERRCRGRGHVPRTRRRVLGKG